MAHRRVAKMSGAGNDFLVLSRDEVPGLPDDADWIRRVCRRGLSVGADGVLFVGPLGPDRIQVEFRNPDGSVAFCGNGTRCAARYARLRGWTGESMVLSTAIGEVHAEARDERVTLYLPPPRALGQRELDVAGDRLCGRFLWAGVPHFIVGVRALEDAPLDRWGPAVRRHPAFGPEGVNLDLVQRLTGSRIRVRTWERGVEGETLACGSGAVAAAFAARLEGADEITTVVPASGIALEV